MRQVVAELLINVRLTPTRLEDLMPTLGVKEIIAEDLPISGLLRREGDSLTIVYSKHLSRTARRFTIAHEFGHAIFERTGPRCPRHGAELERLCDMLAAEILMPTAEFRRQLGNPVTLDEVFHLAQLFDTSIAATSMRVADFADVAVFGLRGDDVRWSRDTSGGRRRSRRVPAVVRRAAASTPNDRGRMALYVEGRGNLILQWAAIGKNDRLCLLSQQIESNQISADRITLEEFRQCYRELIAAM